MTHAEECNTEDKVRDVFFSFYASLPVDKSIIKMTREEKRDFLIAYIFKKLFWL